MTIAGDAGTTIYYTTDGSDVSTKSKLYTIPFVIDRNTTIKAAALGKFGLSEITEYYQEFTSEAPTFSLPNGKLNSPQLLSMACATKNTTIHYTTDGSDPTSDSAVYSGPITIGINTNLKAIALRDGWSNSDVNTAQYNLVTPKPILTPTGGDVLFFIELSCSVPNATFYYTTDGTEPTIESEKSLGSILIERSAIVKVIAVAEGWDPSESVMGEFNVLNVYSIKDEADFFKINDDLYGRYTLWNDITLSSDFIPIGTKEHPFKGSLDGGGCTITVSGNTDGLFSFIEDAQIDGVNVKGDFTTEYSYVGAIAGRAVNSQISNCHVESDITGYALHVGGIAGIIENSKMENCSYNGSIKIENKGGSFKNDYGLCGGGIVGVVTKGGTSIIENCSSAGSLSLDGNGAYNSSILMNAGGVVGCNSQEINNCSSSMSVYARQFCYYTEKDWATVNVGGFAGYCSGTSVVKYCSATGGASSYVYDGVTELNVGGFAGKCVGGAKIIQSYAKGEVRAIDDANRGSYLDYFVAGIYLCADAFCGNMKESSYSAEECYTLCTVSSIHNKRAVFTKDSVFDGREMRSCYYAGRIVYSDNPARIQCYYDSDKADIGEENAAEYARTTAQMKQQSTYVGWDFDNVWAIDPNKNDGYPYLRWEKDVPVTVKEPYVITAEFKDENKNSVFASFSNNTNEIVFVQLVCAGYDKDNRMAALQYIDYIILKKGRATGKSFMFLNNDDISVYKVFALDGKTLAPLTKSIILLGS